jgi:hypothetical protein
MSHSMERSPWEPDSRLPNQEIPLFHGTQMFTAVFTTAHYWSLCLTSWIHSTLSHANYLRPILLLSSNPCLGLLSNFPPWRFTAKMLFTFLTASMRATCPAHLILLIILGKQWNIWSSSTCKFKLHPPVSSPLLCPQHFFIAARSSLSLSWKSEIQ